jgi:hypothetical protein
MIFVRNNGSIKPKRQIPEWIIAFSIVSRLFRRYFLYRLSNCLKFKQFYSFSYAADIPSAPCLCQKNIDFQFTIIKYPNIFFIKDFKNGCTSSVTRDIFKLLIAPIVLIKKRSIFAFKIN